jgi:ankyrin repeat protein
MKIELFSFCVLVFKTRSRTHGKMIKAAREVGPIHRKRGAMSESMELELSKSLGLAVKLGDLQEAERLLDAGANPNGKCVGARRPVEWAIRGGHASIIPALARHGLDLNAIENMVGTPLSYAASEGQESCLRELLAAGADPNAVESLAGWTPLMRAAESGRLGSMLILLEAGARLDATIRRPPVNAKRLAENAGQSACVALLESLELRALLQTKAPNMEEPTWAGPRL